MMLQPSDRPCLQAAVKILAGRSHSRQELRQKLSAKDYDSETIDRVIADLLRRRYLDDGALCRSVFIKYQATGKYGLNAIVARLKQRQFDSSVIQETIKEYDRSQDLQAASTLVNRRFRHAKAEDSAKIGRFLTSRGFSPGTVIRVLENIRGLDDE